MRMVVAHGLGNRPPPWRGCGPGGSRNRTLHRAPGDARYEPAAHLRARGRRSCSMHVDVAALHLLLDQPVRSGRVSRQAATSSVIYSSFAIERRLRDIQNRTTSALRVMRRVDVLAHQDGEQSVGRRRRRPASLRRNTRTKGSMWSPNKLPLSVHFTRTPLYR